MKKLIIMFLFCLSPLISSGQQMKFDWVTKAGGPGWDIVTAINELPNGQLILAGAYYDAIFFPNDTLFSKGSRDVFIARYSMDGHLDRVLNIGGSGYDYVKLAESNVECGLILPIKFNDGLQISERKFEKRLTSNIMLCWFNDSLEFTQSFVLASTREVEITDIKTSDDGSCYFAGWFTDTLQVEQVFYKARDKRDIFIGKISKLGKLEWLNHLQGEGDDYANAIAISKDGKQYLSGITSKGCFGEMNPDSPIEADNHLFTAEIDSIGRILSVNYHIHGSEIIPVDILADSTWLWILASIRNRVSVSEETGDFVTSGQETVTLIKYDSNSKSHTECLIDAEGTHAADGLVKSGDNILITGCYSGKINFGSSTIESTKKGTDIFIAVVNRDCIPKNIIALTGDSDEFPCSALASRSGVYVCGEFKGKLKTDGTELMSAGKEDIFLARIEDCAAKNPLTVKSTVLEVNEGETLWELDAGPEYLSYSWNDGQSASQFFITNQPCTHSVVVQDLFGCIYSGSVRLSTKQDDNPPEKMDLYEFKIYPTVTSDYVYLEPSSSWENNRAYIIVLDISGKIIHKMELDQVTPQTYRIDLSHQTEGTYLIDIEGEGFRRISKVVVIK